MTTKFGNPNFGIQPEQERPDIGFDEVIEILEIVRKTQPSSESYVDLHIQRWEEHGYDLSGYSAALRAGEEALAAFVERVSAKPEAGTGC